MRIGENIYDVALTVPEEIRWLVEYNYLPGAKNNQLDKKIKLIEVYNEYFNPFEPINIGACAECIFQAIEIIEKLIEFWNDGKKK